MTVNNTDYMKNGKKWNNVVIADSFVSRYLEFINITFFDYEGNMIDLPYKIQNYSGASRGIEIKVAEFDNPISFLATFKAVEAGKTTNRAYLSLVDKTAYSNPPSTTVDVVINPFLTLTKTTKEETYYIGDLVEYNVTVENI